MEIILGRRFIMKQRISSGAFGEIYEGIDQTTNKKVALKLEKTKSNKIQLLGEEAKIYKDLQGFIGFPEFYWFGSQNPYNILSIELLDNSLEGFLNKCGGKFTLKTVLMLADQMISTLECLHRHYYIHRDLKPENFMMGVGDKRSIVYLIDFGLSKRYIDVKNDFTHIPYKNHKSMTGTARYASINSLAGVEQSRRDDMESLGYILVYFLKGHLPWQGLPGKTRDEKYNNILDVKRSTSIEELCSGIPHEFADFIRLTRELEFTDEPNYSSYREMFRDLFIQNNFTFDYNYDWVISNSPSKSIPVAQISQIPQNDPISQIDPNPQFPQMSPIPQMSPLPLMSQQPQYSQASNSHRSEFSSRKENPVNAPRRHNLENRRFSGNFIQFDLRNVNNSGNNVVNPNVAAPPLKIPLVRNRRSSYVPGGCYGLNIGFSGRQSSQQQSQRQPPIPLLNPNPNYLNQPKSALSNKVSPTNSNSPLSPKMNKIINVINKKSRPGQWKV